MGTLFAEWSHFNYTGSSKKRIPIFSSFKKFPKRSFQMRSTSLLTYSQTWPFWCHGIGILQYYTEHLLTCRHQWRSCSSTTFDEGLQQLMLLQEAYWTTWWQYLGWRSLLQYLQSSLLWSLCSCLEIWELIIWLILRGTFIIFLSEF